jgi:hypothetical protein
MQIKGSKYTIFGTHQIALTDYYYVLALKIASCIYLYLFYVACKIFRTMLLFGMLYVACLCVVPWH